MEKSRFIKIFSVCALALLLIIAFVSKSKNVQEKLKTQPAKVIPAKVILLPLGQINAAAVQAVFLQLQKLIPNCILLHGEPLPAAAYYPDRNRYRADSIIHFLSYRAKANETYVGLTTTDISTTKNGFLDWGVMGLGYCPGKACVISSFRLKDKSNLYKVVLHELGHTTGLPHCADPTCTMQDANGGDPTGKEKGFCENCKQHLKKMGWKL